MVWHFHTKSTALRTFLAWHFFFMFRIVQRKERCVFRKNAFHVHLVFSWNYFRMLAECSSNGKYIVYVMLNCCQILTFNFKYVICFSITFQIYSIISIHASISILGSLCHSLLLNCYQNRAALACRNYYFKPARPDPMSLRTVRTLLKVHKST